MDALREGVANGLDFSICEYRTTASTGDFHSPNVVSTTITRFNLLEVHQNPKISGSDVAIENQDCLSISRVNL